VGSFIAKYILYCLWNASGNQRKTEKPKERISLNDEAVVK